MIQLKEPKRPFSSYRMFTCSATYDELVYVLGEPTHQFTSGKVQVEWSLYEVGNAHAPPISNSSPEEPVGTRKICIWDYKKYDTDPKHIVTWSAWGHESLFRDLRLSITPYM